MQSGMQFARIMHAMHAQISRRHRTSMPFVRVLRPIPNIAPGCGYEIDQYQYSKCAQFTRLVYVYTCTI